MRLLQNKTATLYTYSRDANMVSTYTAGDTFSCNVQPVSTRDGFEGEIVFKLKKMYTNYEWLSVWDKLVIDGVSYILQSFESWDGSYGKYYKCFIQKSEGS